MDAQSKRVVLSGYYGFRNSGDEAVLQSILLALEEQGKQAGVRIEPVVLSVNPAETEAMYGVRVAHRMRPGELLTAIRGCDGLISGGGSLLQDTTGWKTIPYYLAVLRLAQWLGKPTFIYSQGIGPVSRQRFIPWIRRTFKRCLYVSVRDIESAALLQRMGLAADRIEVVPDPVMGLPLRTGAVSMDAEASTATARTAVPTVGLSVRFWNADRSELQRLADALSRLCKQREVRLRFLPFHLPADEQASRYVMEHLTPEARQVAGVVEGLVHPQDMLAEVSRCDLLIGMRLHSLIYAASQRVPLLGISYDPKIDQFLHRLGMEPAASSTDLQVERVAAEAARLLDSKAEWQGQTKAAVDRLKQQAQQPARQIVSLLTARG